MTRFFQVALDPEKLAGSTLEVFLPLKTILKSIFDVTDKRQNKLKSTNF